jgi:hypothetical protein
MMQRAMFCGVICVCIRKIWRGEEKKKKREKSCLKLGQAKH